MPPKPEPITIDTHPLSDEYAKITNDGLETTTKFHEWTLKAQKQLFEIAGEEVGGGRYRGLGPEMVYMKIKKN